MATHQVAGSRRGRAVPGAGETISHRIPTITVDGAYERAIAPYRSAKATLSFPLKDPIPYRLIEQSAALLVAQRERPTA